MNPMRWMLLAALALAGCKKEKTDTAPTPAPATTEPAATEPAGTEATADAPPAAKASASVDPVDEAPAEGTAPAGDADEKGGDKGKLVAIGADGKTKVLPLSSKVVADTDAYTIKLSAPATMTSGSDGNATIQLIPKGTYHLNKEFPTKLTVAAPADVKLKKDSQGIADAVTYKEKEGKWSFEFKPSAAGDKSFTCKFKFAVCTDTTCEPKKEDLAWNVSVQ